MSRYRKKKGGLNPWDEMSFKEQSQFIDNYNKERSMRGQLEKRIAKLEQIVLKGKKVVSDAADRGRSLPQDGQ